MQLELTGVSLRIPGDKYSFPRVDAEESKSNLLVTGLMLSTTPFQWLDVPYARNKIQNA